MDNSDPAQLLYTVSGQNNLVFEIVSLIRFMTSLPDKKFGMMLKLHNSLTSSEELIDRLITNAERIVKTKVMCLDCTKMEACKFLFVPGLCGSEAQYKLQKHLNVLVEKLEGEPGASGPVERQESTDSYSSCADRVLVKYSLEEMLKIREFVTEPHEALVQASEREIRLIYRAGK